MTEASRMRPVLAGSRDAAADLLGERLRRRGLGLLRIDTGVVRSSVAFTDSLGEPVPHVGAGPPLRPRSRTRGVAAPDPCRRSGAETLLRIASRWASGAQRSSPASRPTAGGTTRPGAAWPSGSCTDSPSAGRSGSPSRRPWRRRIGPSSSRCRASRRAADGTDRASGPDTSGTAPSRGRRRGRTAPSSRSRRRGSGPRPRTVPRSPARRTATSVRPREARRTGGRWSPRCRGPARREVCLPSAGTPCPGSRRPAGTGRSGTGRCPEPKGGGFPSPTYRRVQNLP